MECQYNLDLVPVFYLKYILIELLQYTGMKYILELQNWNIGRTQMWQI